jgi:structural maintenance of chromosome 2
VGGRHQQVVVDTEQTGKLLLQKGGLKRRVTIIPLNKIAHSTLDKARMNKARSMAQAKGGQVGPSHTHTPSSCVPTHVSTNDMTTPCARRLC